MAVTNPKKAENKGKKRKQSPKKGAKAQKMKK
jgi:hypothetical protein